MITLWHVTMTEWPNEEGLNIALQSVSWLCGIFGMSQNVVYVMHEFVFGYVEKTEVYGQQKYYMVSR